MTEARSAGVDTGPLAARRRSARVKSRQLAFALLATVATGLAGFGVGTTIKSPSDVAADRRAPQPSQVTAPVDSRPLTAMLVARGTVRPARSFPVALAGNVGGDAARQVVTVAPAVGDGVTDGDVVIQVSGRPVLALVGAQPMYRLLGPGVSGVDVGQLEDGLARLGFDVGALDGVFDRATARGVAEWYSSRGFAPWPSARDASVAAGELVFLPELPLTVDAVVAGVGVVVSGDVLTLASSARRVDVAVSSADHAHLRSGMSASVDAGDATAAVAASLVDVAQRPGGPLVADVSQFHVSVATSDPLAEWVSGSPVRVSIPIESTGGAAVLCVPLAAVTTSADGVATVMVLDSAGLSRSLAVLPGVVADGFVEVAAVEPGGLRAGDLVVIGGSP